MTTTPIQLDHVIVLLPYRDIVETPAWLTRNFVISPGGRHADGLTENRLILFQDGTYLELIAFIDDDPEKRKGHWWNTDYGIVDFAFTTQGSYDFHGLREKLKATGSDISYADPQKGSRARPDGVEVKWEVTFPIGAERGQVPFWCHDVTPRKSRVPVDKHNTTHPCGAIGMSGLLLEASGSDLGRLRDALSIITENNENVVGTPMNPDSRPTIRIRQKDEDLGKKGYRLSLRLQIPSQEPSHEIEGSSFPLYLEG